MINSSEKELKKLGFKFTDLSERKKKNWNKISIPKNFKNFGFEFFDGNSLGIGYQAINIKKNTLIKWQKIWLKNLN